MARFLHKLIAAIAPLAASLPLALATAPATAENREWDLNCSDGLEPIESWTGLIERRATADSGASRNEAYSAAQGLAEEALVAGVVSIFTMCDNLPGYQYFHFDPEKLVEPIDPHHACRFTAYGSTSQFLWECSVRVATAVVCCSEP